MNICIDYSIAKELYANSVQQTVCKNKKKIKIHVFANQNSATENLFQTNESFCVTHKVLINKLRESVWVIKNPIATNSFLLCLMSRNKNANFMRKLWKTCSFNLLCFFVFLHARTFPWNAIQLHSHDQKTVPFFNYLCTLDNFIGFCTTIKWRNSFHPTTNELDDILSFK